MREKKNIEKIQKNTKNNTATTENYYALLAVILNPKLSVDEAIRRFRL